MTASSISSRLLVPLEAAADADELLERQLVARARQGCPDAFRELVERHQQRIHRFCFHYLHDDGDALEACQDTFVRAHRALPRYKPRARFGTWLFRIALNLCRDRLRARHRRAALPLDGQPEPACHQPAPDEAAMRDADLAKLDRGLESLPSRLRDVLVLSCLDGHSHAECAAILKCSERAIEGRLYRARQRLAAWWEREAR